MLFCSLEQVTQCMLCLGGGGGSGKKMGGGSAWLHFNTFSAKQEASSGC